MKDTVNQLPKDQVILANNGVRFENHPLVTRREAMERRDPHLKQACDAVGTDQFPVYSPSSPFG